MQPKVLRTRALFIEPGLGPTTKYEMLGRRTIRQIERYTCTPLTAMAQFSHAKLKIETIYNNGDILTKWIVK